MLLFVVAFLYETWLSFVRLRHLDKGRSGYVAGTWEVTHTLLVFAVVMLLMTFTQDLTAMAEVLFWPTFIAAIFLGLRAALYLYIFYVRQPNHKPSITDWLFAFMHVGAAGFLVATVVEALVYIGTYNPVANTQFFPAFIPGLVLVLALCVIPLVVIYRSNDKY